MEHIAGRARNADKLHVMEEHLHSMSQVYPSMQDGVAVTSAGVWTLGAFTELIPVNTITEDFDIHFVVLETVSDDEEYELVFYNVETEISRIRFSSDLAAGGRIISFPIPTLMPIEKKNSQIQMKLASSGDTETVVLSVIYHIY